ncbi:MAG: dihydrofolate reductase [Burkholderiales bacterium]|nr:dihydrofolate reductase [Burkholderiales bacterium]
MNAAPRVSLIVAMSRSRVIGAGNRLPWHLPEDLKRFKQLTMGHAIVMGRKTWDSIRRLLPGRTTVIVTRNPRLQVPGALMASSLENALDLCRDDSEVFIIGGEQIFRAALPLADRIYLTIVDIDVPGDTYMPAIDPTRWRRTGSESHPATTSSPLAWRFEIHDRIAENEARP